MPYTLGAVGFGHWFSRLYDGMKRNGSITLSKVAGISDVSSKLSRLKSIGLGANDYYQMQRNGPIPDSFFEGLDVIHISDPNEFHASQTLQSISKGKVTVTEKTFGTTKKEFNEVIDFIESNGATSRTYLHLHYIHKLLTLELDDLLTKFSEEYGKVSKTNAVFFEAPDEEDMRRKDWLFGSKNGGIFMDWIHPFEVLSIGAKATNVSLKNVELYSTFKKYDSNNPTGVLASASVSGDHFSKNSTASISIAKGAPKTLKLVRFSFESDAYLDIRYVDSKIEFSSENRGSWSFYENEKLKASGAPKGPTTSELLVHDIENLCKGMKTSIGIDNVLKVFTPQWQYQKMSSSKRINVSEESVSQFINNGLHPFY